MVKSTILNSYKYNQKLIPLTKELCEVLLIIVTLRKLFLQV